MSLNVLAPSHTVWVWGYHWRPRLEVAVSLREVLPHPVPLQWDGRFACHISRPEAGQLDSLTSLLLGVSFCN
jgi:hypothetical protein